jgi:hypothetical protein
MTKDFNFQLQGYILTYNEEKHTVSFYDANLEKKYGPLVSVNLEYLIEILEEIDNGGELL